MFIASQNNTILQPENPEQKKYTYTSTYITLKS
jgi:hypothetical protein